MLLTINFFASDKYFLQEEAEGAEFASEIGLKCEPFTVYLPCKGVIFQPRVGRCGDLPWVSCDLGNLP